MRANEYGRDRFWPLAEGSGATVGVVTAVLTLAILLWLRFTNLLAGLFLFLSTSLWLLILYIFRDPNRQVVNEPGCVIGPGDGEVVEIVHEREEQYLQADAIRISMFLDITDVHIQRIPLSGQVKLVRYQPGKFLQAFRPEGSDVNENIAMVIEGEYGRILIKQIAGILARRCVNTMRPGDIVQTGQRFGLIKFSSRLDLFLPPDAQLLVTIGDKVYGGLTPIAQLKKP
jgi:phosphatidylserine decarboxylase